MDAGRMARSLSRIAHEILERHPDPRTLALVGVRSRGVPLARRLARLLEEAAGSEPAVGAIDISLYRDDFTSLAAQPITKGTDILFSLDGRTVVLVDDVLYTGRTVRAALDELIDFGRPARIELAVLVDRGHRELPIRADYVGRTLATARDEAVQVLVREEDGRDEVLLHRKPAAAARAEGRAPARRSRSRARRRGGRPGDELPAPAPARDRAARGVGDPDDPGHRRGPARDPRPADQEGARAARQDGRQPVLRSLDAHALLVRDRRARAVGRQPLDRRRRLERDQGRDAARHRAQPRGDEPRHGDRAPREQRRAAPAREALPLLGRERGRRRARAPDAGAARRAHDPPEERAPPRAQGGDRGRHPAQPRGALEPVAALQARRQGGASPARRRWCRPGSRASRG